MALARTEPRQTLSLRLPADLVETLDEQVAAGMAPTRTALIERAIRGFLGEMVDAKVVYVEDVTLEEAQSRILNYLKERPHTYISELAEELKLDLEVTIRAVQELAGEGRIAKSEG